MVEPKKPREPETPVQAVERLEKENSLLRSFVEQFAALTFVEVYYIGLFSSDWRCQSCGYTAPNAGHYSDCRAVRARSLLGKSHPTDERLKVRLPREE